MEFGILFTSHPNPDVHARVTREIVRADALGYDYAWIAEPRFAREVTPRFREDLRPAGRARA